MKENYIIAIYNAAKNVFKMMMNIDVQQKKLKSLKELSSNNEVSIILGIKGDLEGSIIFGFSKKVVLKMVSSMSGMQLKKIDTFVASAIGEIANIVGGHSTTYLSEKNYICDILPPRLFIGIYNSKSNNDPVVLQLETSIGDFDIIIDLNEKKK